jgi:uncharacterized protein (DUF58 family)
VINPMVPPAVEAAARGRGRLSVAFAPRALAGLAFGIAWLIPALVDSRFLLALAGWDGLVVAAWLVDLARLPPPDRLRVRREWLGPAALAEPSQVALEVENASTRRLAVALVDTVPSQVRRSPPVRRVLVDARGAAVTRYDVRPSARGAAPIGAVHLRYRSLMGLAERWAIADLAQTVVAYPMLADAARHSVYLIRSRQTVLEKRSARIRGAGRAFESLREYRDGDDFRDVCWTATARRGRPVTKLYEVERSQTIWIVLDTGRLMRARVRGLTKLDYAVNAALALTHVALGSGDRVGVLAYGRRVVQRVPAAGGRAHLRRIVDHLATVREDEWEADHLLAASRLLHGQARRSLVVWITDVAETALTPDVVRAATLLVKRHVVLFVVIGELDLQMMAGRTPETVADMYETASAQEVIQRRDLLLATLRRGGALALETAPAGLSLAVVNQYLEVKQRGRI